MGLSLAGYRPWEGVLNGAWRSPLPIARIALKMVFRRKLFWGLYMLALMNFMVFFSGIYLLSQIDVGHLLSEGAGRARILFIPVKDVTGLVDALKNQLHLGGNANTFRNFFWYQGYIVMAVLALAGSIIVGNDYRHGSLPFYLSKPLGRWHYLLGKFLAVGLFINMMTTIPALLLFIQCGLLTQWSYFSENFRLFWGILGYGATVTVVLSLLVVAAAAWVRRTVPLIMIWAGLLFFARAFASAMVDGLKFHERWRLIDVWNNMYVVGSEALGTAAKLGNGRSDRPQPDSWEAAAVLIVVCVICLIYLNKRIRAVEIVR